MVYPTDIQDVITTDKLKETFRLHFALALVEKMFVLPRLIKENGKVDLDMFYPTGSQDVIQLASTRSPSACFKPWLRR